MKHKIICGHVIPALETLPDKHVDMLMTSVPYWGLRDYGADTATIWGGDKDCEHDFSPSETQHDNLRYRGAISIVGNEKNEEIHKGKENSSGAFCSLCGAWHGQLGLEPTPELYIEHLRMVFAEVKRVLKKTGTCWVNIGDSYAGSSKGIGSSPDPKWRKARNDDMKHKTDWDGINLPAKCMCLIPERFAFMMIDLGYILRNKIIWHKPNSMPSSVKDRFNTTYEMLYFFSKSKKYWFDLDAVREEHKPESLIRVKGNWNGHREPMSSYQGMDIKRMCSPSGKNPGDFWSINTQPFPEAHFAVFPEKLCEKPILAGCPAEVCTHCGKARVRITKTIEDINNVPKEGWKKSYRGKTELNGSPQERSVSELYKESLSKQRETIGWTDCPCSDENKYEPGITIDPFGGSGTVGIVAEKLGRSSILIDIKKDYCEMAFKRLKTLTEQTKLIGERSEIEKIGF